MFLLFSSQSCFN